MLKLKYFVLKPAGNSTYAKASRKALAAYADYIVATDPDLAKELLDWTAVEYEAVLCATDGVIHLYKAGTYSQLAASQALKQLNYTRAEIVTILGEKNVRVKS